MSQDIILGVNGAKTVQEIINNLEKIETPVILYSKDLKKVSDCLELTFQKHFLKGGKGDVDVSEGIPMDFESSDDGVFDNLNNGELELKVSYIEYGDTAQVIFDAVYLNENSSDTDGGISGQTQLFMIKFFEYYLGGN
jgi:hypothetical protein